jgi:hypothetical protein
MKKLMNKKHIGTVFLARDWVLKEAVFFLSILFQEPGWLDGWMAAIQFPAGARTFSLLHSIEVGPGAYPTNGYQGLFPGG